MTSVSVNVSPPGGFSPATTPVARSVKFSTLGCKVNAFESELIAEKIAGDNYHRVGSTDQADLYIINTCTVTAEADRQARQLVRRAVRENPDAWVVVTGCYAQMDAKTCSEIPGVDLVVGNSQKLDIPDLLDDLYCGKLPPVLQRNIDAEISLPNQLLQGFDGHSRVFVQIQQGCDQGCTFCIIHTARGPNRSFAPEMIKRQCERLIMNGYAEIVLCGVDIGSYGNDIDSRQIGLTELLNLLLEIPGDYRLRLSSIDPAHITDEFIDLLGKNKIICPQLHLSLQSANTLILKRMKRRASRELIYDRIHALRDAIPELVLSADILVGFPTETETQFSDTLRAVHELDIAYPHVFTYSPRAGTPAARIPSKVPKSESKRRAKLIRNAGQEVWERVAETLVGRKFSVIEESSLTNPESDQCWKTGRAANYFPVRYQAAAGSSMYDDFGVNESCWSRVEIIGVDGNMLLGRITDEVQPYFE
jgi:threonylcarbamoyladenosine tRNA methylthiotransferase MtaB